MLLNFRFVGSKYGLSSNQGPCQIDQKARKKEAEEEKGASYQREKWSVLIWSSQRRHRQRGWKSWSSPSLEVEQIKQQEENYGEEDWDWEYEGLVEFQLKWLRIKIRRAWILSIIMIHHSPSYYHPPEQGLKVEEYRIGMCQQLPLPPFNCIEFLQRNFGVWPLNDVHVWEGCLERREWH